MSQENSENSTHRFPSVSETNSRPVPAGDCKRPEIPGYEIVELLGQGGMGLVWKAVQHSPKREVALKQMNLHALGSSTARARFRAEVQVAAHLEHPNIARIYDCCIDRQPYYFTMELIRGQRLDEYVKQNSLSPRQIMALIHALCIAMAYAHDNKVIHRDLKPSNILITEDGVPHIVDFGVAKWLDNEATQLTVSDTSKGPGTLVYMSPEQVMGKPVSTHTDIYSVGVIAYRLLAEAFPYDLSGSEYECMQNITQQEPIPLRRIVPGIDTDLESIVLTALSKLPGQRYGTFSDLAADLERWLNGRAISIKSNRSLYRIKKYVAQHIYSIRVMSLVLVILVASAIIVIEAFRSNPDRPSPPPGGGDELSAAMIFTDLLQSWNQKGTDPTGSMDFLSEGTKEKAALGFLLDHNEPQEKRLIFEKNIRPDLMWFCDYICGEDYLKRGQTTMALASFKKSDINLVLDDSNETDALVFYKYKISQRIRELIGSDPNSQNRQ